MTDLHLPVAGPMHRAALALHAMEDGDRSWLLDALPAGQQAGVKALLEELRALGIPRDPALLQDLRADWPRQLDARAVAALVQVLSREPAGVTRALLAMDSWHWAPQILAALGMHGSTVARTVSPRVRAVLLAALQTQCGMESVAPAGPSPWQRARCAFGARGRSA